MPFGKEVMITLNVVTIMRRICEEVDYGFTDLNMRSGVMNLTHHMLNVESICSSTVKTILELECALILVLTETDHTVLLTDKYWLQAAMLVMSSSETTVRQLQCGRSDETLVLASFLGADSVIRMGIAHSKSAGKVSTGMKRRGKPFTDNAKRQRETSCVSRATLRI